MREKILEMLEDINIGMTVYVNDFFGYSSSHAFEVFPEEYELFADLHKRFGSDGVYALLGAAEGVVPIKERISDNYREAEKYIKDNELIKKRYLYSATAEVYPEEPTKHLGANDVSEVTTIDWYAKEILKRITGPGILSVRRSLSTDENIKIVKQGMMEFYTKYYNKKGGGACL